MLAARYDASTVVEGQGRVQGLAPGEPGWPSGPTSRCSRRSAVSTHRRVGTCWPRSPTGCWSATFSSWFWAWASQVSRAARETWPRRYPGKFWAYLGFSDDLAHQIEAGADLFLMPSLFEPCGLNQLYSLAHGTVPIVRATGGLADTVVDANPADARRRHRQRLRLRRADRPSALEHDRTGAGALARPRRLATAHARQE